MDEEVRLREPNRKQLILQSVDYETLISAEHPARAIWRVLEAMDLSRFCAPIKARENSPGRDATDPRVLLALWLYGLSEGVNSAREIARLCAEQVAYRWICGGVSINYHTLSDFRSGRKKGLDPTQVRVVSYGASKPVDDNSTRSGRRKNRRVEILVYQEKIAS